ncbi:MAG: hypothetical protein ACLUVM_13660 [Blautia faecis]
MNVMTLEERKELGNRLKQAEEKGLSEGCIISSAESWNGFQIRTGVTALRESGFN